MGVIGSMRPTPYATRCYGIGYSIYGIPCAICGITEAVAQRSPNEGPLTSYLVFAEESVEVGPAVAGKLHGFSRVAFGPGECLEEHRALGFVRGP